MKYLFNKILLINKCLFVVNVCLLGTTEFRVQISPALEQRRSYLLTRERGGRSLLKAGTLHESERKENIVHSRKRGSLQVPVGCRCGYPSVFAAIFSSINLLH